MPILDFIFKKTNIRADQPLEPDLTDTNGIALLRGLLNGTSIDKDKALSIPAVSSAVDRISNSVAILPIRLFKEEKTADGNNKTVEVKDDDRVKLLNTDTGDTLDPFQFKKALVQDYLLGKGAFAYIEKNKNKFKSIRYVDEVNVSYQKNTDPIFKDAKYLINGGSYETYQLLTILRNTKDGFQSDSLVKEVNNVLETAVNTLIYELGLVKKGGAKSGFLQAKNKLDDNAISKLKEAWRSYYSNTGENVVVLNNGIEFKDGANSSVELQLNERKKTLKDDINDVFHISPEYNIYIKDAVIPIISAIESALNKNFLLEEEKGSFYFVFDITQLERGDTKTRFEIYKLAKEIGMMTKNEMRYLEDYEPIDGLDVVSLGLGDVFYDVKQKKYFTPNTGKTTNLVEVNPKGGDEM